MHVMPITSHPIFRFSPLRSLSVAYPLNHNLMAHPDIPSDTFCLRILLPLRNCSLCSNYFRPFSTCISVILLEWRWRWWRLKTLQKRLEVVTWIKSYKKNPPSHLFFFVLVCWIVVLNFFPDDDDKRLIQVSISVAQKFYDDIDQWCVDVMSSPVLSLKRHTQPPDPTVFSKIPST